MEEAGSNKPASSALAKLYRAIKIKQMRKKILVVDDEKKKLNS